MTNIFDDDPFMLKTPRDEKKELVAAFRLAAKGFAFDALERIEQRALSSNDDTLRQRADEFLVGYGFARPAQSVDATLSKGDGWGVINFGFPIAQIGSRTDAGNDAEALLDGQDTDTLGQEVSSGDT